MRFFYFLITIGILTSLAGCSKEPAAKAEEKSLKIMVFKNGDITVEGQAATLDQVSAKLADLKRNNDVALYHRENPQGERHPNAMKVMDLVNDCRSSCARRRVFRSRQAATL